MMGGDSSGSPESSEGADGSVYYANGGGGVY